jgi:hypothetical protein
MDNDLTALHNYAAKTDRLAQTPTPVSYTRHISRSLMLWLLTMPVCSVGAGCPWWITGLGTALVSWLLLGIDDLGMQLEQPYTVMALKQFCEDVQVSLSIQHVLKYPNTNQIMTPDTDQSPHQNAGRGGAGDWGLRLDPEDRRTQGGRRRVGVSKLGTHVHIQRHGAGEHVSEYTEAGERERAMRVLVKRADAAIREDERVEFCRLKYVKRCTFIPKSNCPVQSYFDQES